MRALGQALFHDVLDRERRRADRFEQPFLLLLVRWSDASGASSWSLVADALTVALGHTAMVGWFEQDVLGVIVPELRGDSHAVVQQCERSVTKELTSRLDAGAIASLSIQVHVHTPPNSSALSEVAASAVMLNLRRATPPVRQALKRTLDVIGSLVLLLLLSPLLFCIAVLVKLGSPGPVLFRQTRVGHGARPFTMLKFRTMQADADVSLHRAFVTRLINPGGGSPPIAENGLFKIVDDPRITSVGRILRRTSLDELPQLWNVLKGEMSLVGPRPPLPYEVEQYRPWHWRRVLDAKPGITGLWQVTGRSRTTFDEMVRLDLRYVRASSLWTDIKILLATPRAVVTGKGAC
ncbi:MAG TPA: sugar transferase [Rhodothermales bacterium]